MLECDLYASCSEQTVHAMLIIFTILIIVCLFSVQCMMKAPLTLGDNGMLTILVGFVREFAQEFLI